MNYDVSRKQAAKMLGVSIRTVDRYLKGKKLSRQVYDGSVYLSSLEIARYKEGNSSFVPKGSSGIVYVDRVGKSDKVDSLSL